MAFITFITANVGLIVTLTLALLSLLTALFNKNEKAKGIIAIIRNVIERLSLLQPKNSAGTVKVPGVKAGPTPIF